MIEFINTNNNFMQIMELETKVTQYEEEIKEKKSGKEKSKETLPRGPPRHILKGKCYE